MFAAADVNLPTRPIEGIGRLLMRVVCVALAFLGTPDAQAQTKVIVPVPGFYAHAAPGTNMLYEKRDAANAIGQLDVLSCGNVLRIIPKDGPAIELFYNEGVWEGVQGTGRSRMRYRLGTHSETQLELTIIFPWGNGEPSSLRLVQEADTPGSARITLIKQERIRESLFWAVDEQTYMLDLTDFDVNKSELKPEHVQAIEQAVAMIQTEPEQIGYCTEKMQPNAWHQVVGFASQTGPERVNQRLAHARALETAVTLNQYRTDEDNPFAIRRLSAAGSSSVPEVLDNPGLESSCNRRAIWQFTLRRRFVDPYPEELAEEWLRKDMRAECLASERPAGETTDLSIEVGNRTRIRGQYALARNFLEMMASGYCEPRDNANGEAAKRLFDYGGTADANGNLPYESAVEAAYEAARVRNRENLFSGGLRSEQKRRTEIGIMQGDPYYCYTYRQNLDALNRALEIEKEECGSVLTYPGETDSASEYEIGEDICRTYHGRNLGNGN